MGGPEGGRRVRRVKVVNQRAVGGRARLGWPLHWPLHWPLPLIVSKIVSKLPSCDATTTHQDAAPMSATCTSSAGLWLPGAPMSPVRQTHRQPEMVEGL